LYALLTCLRPERYRCIILPIGGFPTLFRAVGLSILALILAGTLSCGGGSSNSPYTATVGTASSPASNPVTATAGGPSEIFDWTVSGQYSGTAQMTMTTCDIVGNQDEIGLDGTLNGVNFYIGSTFSTTASGTLTYSSPNDLLFVEVKYGTGTTGTPAAHWNNGSGFNGIGTATIGAQGSGSMDVTVPPSANSPAGATVPIRVSGDWTCP
jgi:hypothetical protein